MAAFISGAPLTLLSGNQLLFFEVDSRGIHEATRMEFPGQLPWRSHPRIIPASLRSWSAMAESLFITGPDEFNYGTEALM